jgi:hypothetical protein
MLRIRLTSSPRLPDGAVRRMLFFDALDRSREAHLPRATGHLIGMRCPVAIRQPRVETLTRSP